MTKIDSCYGMISLTLNNGTNRRFKDTLEMIPKIKFTNR